jgi:hypothetical protein
VGGASSSATSRMRTGTGTPISLGDSSSTVRRTSRSPDPVPTRCVTVSRLQERNRG